MASAVAPVVVKYVPAPQSVHATVPMTDLYVPAAQYSQVEAPVLLRYLPTPQSVQPALPAGELMPAGQSMHVAALEAPRVVEYFPAGHAAQVSALLQL